MKSRYSVVKPHTVSTQLQENIQSSSSGSSSTMYAYKTNLPIAQTTTQSSCIFLHWNKKVKCHISLKKKYHHPGFEPRTPRSRRTATYLFTYSGAYMTIYQIDTSKYVSMRTNRSLGKIGQQTKTARRRWTPRARSRPLLTCRVGRGE